jgi:PAS domain S-box-containing protein
MIDMRTIILSYIITNITCTSVMMLLWLQNRKHFDGIGFWLGQYIAIFTAVVLLALRGIIPDFLSIVIANTLVIFGLILLYMGVQRFVCQTGSQTHNFILLVAFILVHAWFTYPHPSLLARNINVSVCMFIYAFQIAWFIFRKDGTDSSFNLRGLGVIFIFYCLVSIARTTTDLIIDPGANFLKTGTDSLVFLAYQALQIALTLSLFLQVNRQLIFDLEHDIIKRKQAEEAARASEALYHQMFTDHSAVKLLIDPESGSIVEANLAAVNFYGYPGDVLHQMNIQQINTFLPEDVAKLRQEIQVGKLDYFSVPHRLASGEIREAEVYSVPINVNGRALLYSIIHDITRRNQVEKALKESESHYRAVAQSANDAVISANSNGNIIGWNRGAETIFGYSEIEAMDQPLTLLMPDHFQNGHLAGMDRVQGGGERRIIGKTVEMQGRRKNGFEFPMEMSLAEWQVDDTQFYTAIIRDITERKQAEEALLQTQNQVVEQQRAVATFEERERVARELHDGIGQILGYVNVQAQAAQTLLEKNQLEAVQKNLEEVVQVVQGAHASLRHTILGLRDSISPQRDFCRALLAYLNSFHQAWNIETVFSPPQEELPALPAAVEDQILHVIQEALVNIRKHAHAKRVEVLISLRPGEISFIVSDDGRGFDMQNASGAEKEHFGLSIMRERAEQVGGRLEVRSSIGHGTRVFVHIPLISTPPLGQQDAYSLRILLADDQPLFLNGLQNLLKARGLTIIGMARDGLEAFEQVKALRPDVVLMDVQMPKCDGIEATRLIKAEFPETRVVLLTVSEDDEHLLDAVKYGASSYLLKNLDANQLFSTLDGLARGEIQITPKLVSRLLRDFNQAGNAARSANMDDTIPAELSMRQWEVLRLVARGLTYKEAGRELHLTEPAIKYHMGQILDRLQLKNREEAVTYLHKVKEETRRKKNP